MSPSLKVYGFGSFFADGNRPSDLDLLLLHQTTDKPSCQFAIECKNEILKAIPNADVVMLSQREAETQEFLVRSKAVELGSLDSDDLGMQVQELALRIRTRRPSLKS